MHRATGLKGYAVMTENEFRFVHEDTFLTPFLGVSAYHLPSLPAVDEQEDFKQEIDRIAGSSPCFISAKVSTCDLVGARLLEQNGFNVVDVNITLEKECDRSSLPVETSYSVRQAVASDKDAIVEIAGDCLTTSRFHLDTRIPNSAAREVKRHWVANYFSGLRGDGMSLAEVHGVPVAFLQWILSGNALVIDLIAVSHSMQGQGIGAALVRETIRANDVSSRVLVGTQACNVSSLRFYESIGFRIVGTQYVYHRHGANQSTCI